jgi:hypothetical protein
MRLAGLRRLGLWWVVAAFVVVGVGVIVAGRLRIGGFLIGLGLLVGAVLRLVVKEPRAGGIEIRSKARDVITLVVAAALVFGAFFLVRTCAPGDTVFGGARAASCPGPP